MNAREKYAEVHAEYMKAMYSLLITDTDLYNKVQQAASNCFTAAFDFGAECARKKVTSEDA